MCAEWANNMEHIDIDISHASAGVLKSFCNCMIMSRLCVTMPWQGTEVPNKIEASLNVDYQEASMIWLPDINKNPSPESSQGSMEAVISTCDFLPVVRCGTVESRGLSYSFISESALFVLENPSRLFTRPANLTVF